MTAFVVITGDEKYSVINPHIIGPFDTHDDAAAFAERVCIEPIDGGYRGVVVVSGLTVDIDPTDCDEFDEDWAWLFGDQVEAAS